MEYNTVYDSVAVKYEIEKSVFVGTIAPVSTEDEANAFIGKIKSENRKANHNVYAYILRNGQVCRYSDDKEPKGTAGIPVLGVLQKKNLVDVCCVVTRYFGGVLLGAGGLVRAYSNTASITAEAAQTMVMTSCYEVFFEIDYTLYGRISIILPEYNVKIVNIDFGENIKITLLVRESNYFELVKAIMDATNGKIELCKSNIMFRSFA